MRASSSIVVDDSVINNLHKEKSMYKTGFHSRGFRKLQADVEPVDETKHDRES